MGKEEHHRTKTIEKSRYRLIRPRLIRRAIQVILLLCNSSQEDAGAKKNKQEA